jgi:hypothetical protein
LIERHVPADHVLDPVTDNHHHVPEFDHVGFVANATVTRNDIGPCLLSLGGDREVQDVIEPCNLALYAAAVIDVEERIRPGA